MTWHAGRGQVVLLGGADAHPRARWNVGLGRHELRVVVLYGGRGDAGDFADTWTFDGAAWEQMLPD